MSTSLEQNQDGATPTLCPRKVVQMPVTLCGQVAMVSCLTECDADCTTGPLERQVSYIKGLLVRRVELGTALFCPQEL